MIKSDLIKKLLRRHPYMTNIEAQSVVDLFLETLIKGLHNGEKIEFRGFGIFGVKNRKSIVTKNPKNGEKICIKSRNYVFYKMGKNMKELLNSSEID